MIKILIAILLLLAIFMMIFAMLLISADIVNSLIRELTVYDDITDMIKARKGALCYIHHGFYGDWLCCGNCNSHYRIIFDIAMPNLKPENIQEKDES